VAVNASGTILQETALRKLEALIPIDRCRALAGGRILPDRTQGAALFADTSGFTPLTEALARALGRRLGPEELAKQINCIFEVLIAEVRRYGGSVTGFSGDAIACWFDGDKDGRRATTCALSHSPAKPFSAGPAPGGCSVRAQ
jgi:adenylate cyclase